MLTGVTVSGNLFKNNRKKTTYRFTFEFSCYEEGTTLGSDVREVHGSTESEN